MPGLQPCSTTAIPPVKCPMLQSATEDFEQGGDGGKNLARRNAHSYVLYLHIMWLQIACMQSLIWGGYTAGPKHNIKIAIGMLHIGKPWMGIAWIGREQTGFPTHPLILNIPRSPSHQPSLYP